MKKFFAIAFVLLLVLLAVPIFATQASPTDVTAPAVSSAVTVVAPSADAVILRETGGIKALLLVLSSLIAALIVVLTHVVYLIRGRSVMATIENFPIQSEGAPIQTGTSEPRGKPPKKNPVPATTNTPAGKKRPGRKPKSPSLQSNDHVVAATSGTGAK